MGAIAKLFGGGDRAPPAPTAPPPVPMAPTPPQIMAARDRNRAMAGMAGTILTGPLGLETKGKTTRGKSLLGQ